MIRVAGPRQVPWEEGTEIKNISLSGLAFTAHVELCPIVGEFIKIEFQVPPAASKSQMACFGLVTRLEPAGKSEMLVGIQFYKLEMPHRIILLQGLANKLKEQQKIKSDLEAASQISWLKIVKNWKVACGLILLLSAWLALMEWSWS